MFPAVFSLQTPASVPVVVLVAAAGAVLALSGLFIFQRRRQVQAAWAETGRIYQRSTARFDAVGDLLDDILFETNASRILTYTNRAFGALTGYRDRDLRSGLALIDLVEPEERSRLSQDLDPAHTGPEVRVRTYHLRCRDGATAPVTTRRSALTESQRLLGWRGLLERLPPESDPAAATGRTGAIEQVLGEILHDLNVTPAENHGAALGRGLAAIGRLLGADRCYHYACNGRGASLVSLRQWYAPGVSPLAADQRLPGLEQFPWTVARLREDGAAVVPEVQALDPIEVPERERWYAQGITSLLVVPLRRDGAIDGLLGCETLGHARHWGLRDRQVLEAMAEICQRVEDHAPAGRRSHPGDEPAADLVDGLPEPVAVIGPDGLVTAWNAALAELSGVAAERARGRPATRAVADFLPTLGDWLDERLRTQAPAACALGQVAGSAGRGPLWIQVTLRPLGRHGARDGRRFLHFCDVTDALAAARNYPAVATSTVDACRSDR